ncbi:soluble quino protein glucose/sorbosone dehydrogenase [Chytridium lagenaria]|nr:soluble quino protein glucose/sorbosone dehydrogenase [Chytridium lagenaria]
MRSLIALLAIGAVVAQASQLQQQQIPLGTVDEVDAYIGVPGLTTVNGVSATLIADGIPVPRGIEFDDKGDLIVLSRGGSKVVALWKEDGVWQRKTIIDAADLQLTHSVILHEAYVYASSPSTVYRWPYIPGSRNSVDPKSIEIVIKDINGQWGGGQAGHDTRTLLVGKGYLYVSLGSRSNIDPDSRAAIIRRFPLGSIPKGGVTFVDGEVWAEGTRNNIAMAFDKDGRLWGAENGADNLSRNDLHRIPNLHKASADYHNDSPVEEVNLFDDPTAFYGYPYCFTAGNVTTTFEVDAVRGSQWVWPNFFEDGKHSDEWCRRKKNNRPPSFHIPAHSAPIAMKFFEKTSQCGNGAIPCKYQGSLFVTLHGSWNRDIPSGFSVIVFENDGGGKLIQKIRTLAHATNFQMKCKGRDSINCFRPAGLAISPHGTLFVSSDTTGEIVELTFED